MLLHLSHVWVLRGHVPCGAQRLILGGMLQERAEAAEARVEALAASWDSAATTVEGAAAQVFIRLHECHEISKSERWMVCIGCGLCR